MKRMFTWMLVLTVLLCLPLFAAAKEAPVSDFTWEANDDGSVTVTKYTGSGGEAVIPAQIDGKPVTRIDGSAFRYCDNLTSITLPSSVTTIGYRAFSSCENLLKVTFASPSQLTAIGGNVFSGCSNLQFPDFPDTVSFIDAYAFDGCSGLTSVVLHSSASTFYVGKAAFNNCSNLTDISISSAGTVSIGHWAFDNCASLSKVTIDNPDNLQVGQYVFNNHLQVSFPQHTNHVCTPSGILVDLTTENEATIIGYVGNASEIVIPRQIEGVPVTSISGSGFSSCDSLASVIIPESVTSIGDSAFYYCISLTSVTIQNPNIQLGATVFSESFLQRLVLPEGRRYVCTPSGILADLSGEHGATIVGYIGKGHDITHELVIPSQINGQPVTSIAPYAFWAARVESIIIPDSVTSIGTRAFQGTYLEYIVLPDSVTSIAYGAFYDLYVLAAIDAPEPVRQMAEDAYISFL